MTLLADAGRLVRSRPLGRPTTHAIHPGPMRKRRATPFLQVDGESALHGIAELLEGFYARRAGKLLADSPCRCGYQLHSGRLVPGHQRALSSSHRDVLFGRLDCD